MGPAAIYVFGYFRTFPDALGTGTKSYNDSVLQRWSNLARMSSGLAIIITCICWASIATKHFRGIVVPLKQTPSVINLFVMGTLSAMPGVCIIGAILAAALITICVVASEQFLARTMGSMSPCPDKNWGAIVLRIVGRCGGWLARFLRPKSTLVLGGVLLLFSLIAPMVSFWRLRIGGCHGSAALADRGIHIGRSCTHDPVPGRPLYVHCDACHCCAGAGSRGDAKSWRALAQSECARIHPHCDRNILPLRSDTWYRPLGFYSTAAAEPGCARAGMGITYFRLDKASAWRKCALKPTRIAVMVLYLPLVLAGLALVPFALVLIPSYACFLLGTGFLTLGFVRSRWEATAQPIHLDTESKFPQAA